MNIHGFWWPEDLWEWERGSAAGAAINRTAQARTHDKIMPKIGAAGSIFSVFLCFLRSPGPGGVGNASGDLSVHFSMHFQGKSMDKRPKLAILNTFDDFLRPGSWPHGPAALGLVALGPWPAS